MKKSDLIRLIAANANDYRKDVLKDISTNKHVNRYDGEPIQQSTADAILVGFVNRMCKVQGLDVELDVDTIKTVKKDGIVENVK